MKRIGLWGGLLVLALLLTACVGEYSPVYEVEYDGETYTVDSEKQTITHGGTTVQMEWSRTGGGSEVTFVYPDGSTYRWRQNDGFGAGGGSEDYAPEQGMDARTLLAVMDQHRTDSRSPRWGSNPLLGLVLIVLGAVNLVFPKELWFLRYGWRYKNAEPSEMAVWLPRVGGGIAVLVGLVLLFV